MNKLSVLLVASAIALTGCTQAAEPAPTPGTPTASAGASVEPTVPAASPGQEVDAAALTGAIGKAQREARTATASFEIVGSDGAKQGSGTAGLDFADGEPKLHVRSSGSGGIEVIIDGATAAVKAGDLTGGRWLRGPLAALPDAVGEVQATYDFAALAPRVTKAAFVGAQDVGGVATRHYTLTGPNGLTQDVWIDDADRPVRSERAQGERVNATFGQYGEPVQIPTPEPSSVVEVTP
ncbi:hypothetical protein [Nigerium massiliense]|uniref:hypothetical protein n=1 Tax=Nigerium massiliense TaxID=1522317 RepID=UPI00058BDA3F|nr:hypothetical protein [Nigerium massiliense]